MKQWLVHQIMGMTKVVVADKCRQQGGNLLFLDAEGVVVETFSIYDENNPRPFAVDAWMEAPYELPTNGS